MNGASECAEIRWELGVYVLGAISPADRGRVDWHLQSCPQCRQELARLAGLPALLHRVPAVEAGRPFLEGAPEALLGTLLGRAGRLRRRRRWAGAAAAAVLIGGAGTGWGWQVLGHGARPPAAPVSVPAEPVEGFNPATGAGAIVRYTPQAWGTELEASVSGIPTGTACQIWVTTVRGQHIAAGSWMIARGWGWAWYPGSVESQAAGLRDFDITAGGRVLVAVPVR